MLTSASSLWFSIASLPLGKSGSYRPLSGIGDSGLDILGISQTILLLYTLCQYLSNKACVSKVLTLYR
jgi:hypothetical protein